MITITSLKLIAEYRAEIAITSSRGPVPKMLWHGSVANFLFWASKLQTKHLTLSCQCCPIRRKHTHAATVRKTEELEEGSRQGRKPRV